MIPKHIEILAGTNVIHDEGLLYQVEDVRRSTDGYESAHELGGMVVNYTQLEAGSYPPGTKWCKDEEGFREFFTLESSSQRPDYRV